MSETVQEPSSDTEKITECPIRAAEHYVMHNDRPYATRGEVLGALARGGRSLEDAHAAIYDALGDDLLRHPNEPDRLVPARDAETLLAFLEDYLERADRPDSEFVGRINARRQELRNGGDV